MLKGFRETWKQLEDCVIRPPRAVYTADELVGGSSGRFVVGRQRGMRRDLELTNCHQQTIQCSYFRPVGDGFPPEREIPCVIYCHCNSGCRCEANEAVTLLIPAGIAVMALDFAGSGQSEGQYVSLGVREVDDVSCAVAELRRGITTNANADADADADADASRKVLWRTGRIALWGRSMGAVVCILYGQRDPSVCGIVMDSPFSRLGPLMVELARDQAGFKLPQIFLKSVVGILRRSIRKRAGFDINDADPLASAPLSFIPALFGHGLDDNFIKVHHSQKLCDAYAGDKNLITFDGDHNAHRPEFFVTSVIIFLHNVFSEPSVGRAPKEHEQERQVEDNADGAQGNGDQDDEDLQKALALSLSMT